MLSSTTTKTPKMTATAGQTVFPYTNIRILTTDQLEVYVDDVIQTSGYSLPGVPTDGTGGTIVFATPMVGGEIVQARRVPPLTQTGGYTETGKFPASAHELNLDKLAMQTQYIDERVDRAIKWAFGVDTPTALPSPVTYSGYALGLHSVDGLAPLQILSSDIGNPLVTKGDLLYHDGSAVVRLALGSTGANLTVNGVSDLPVWGTRSVYSASHYGVPTSGSGDVRINLQNILDEMDAAGLPATLELTQGAVYHISSSLIIPSDTIIRGNGASIIAHSSWVGDKLTNSSALIRNKNHGYLDYPSAVTSLTDKNIVIENLHFDYDGNAAAGDGNICIWLRYVDRYLIRNCTFTDCGDATGILACRDGLTDHCYADGFINAGYDHWDGCIDCGVTNSTLRSTLTDTAQGIQFTGTGSSNEVRTTTGCYAAFNKVYGVRHTSTFASAIIFNAGHADSDVTYGLSMGNYIEDSDNGVVFDGDGGYHVSIGDTLKGVTYAPMFMQHSSSNSPDYSRFIDTTLIDCDNISGSALVTITGIQPEVRGLKVVDTTGTPPYPYLVNIASTSTDAHIQITSGPTGSSGRILNNGTTTRIHGEAVSYTPVLSFGGALTGITYTSRVGTYTRNGDTVHVRGTIVVNDNGSASGGAAISLPVTGATATLNGLATCWMSGASGLTSAVTGAITTGGTVMALYDHGATGAVAIDENNIINGTTISFDASYRVVV